MCSLGGDGRCPLQFISCIGSTMHPVANLVQLKSFNWHEYWFVSQVYLGFLWCIMWLLCVADTPSQHPRITESERKYIESSIGGNSRHIPASFNHFYIHSLLPLVLDNSSATFFQLSNFFHIYWSLQLVRSHCEHSTAQSQSMITQPCLRWNPRISCIAKLNGLQYSLRLGMEPWAPISTNNKKSIFHYVDAQDSSVYFDQLAPWDFVQTSYGNFLGHDFDLFSLIICTRFPILYGTPS